MIKDNLSRYYISLEEATKFCNYSQEYLSLRARQGKLKSKKIGRNWVTTKEWLDDYLKQVQEFNGQAEAFKILTDSRDSDFAESPAESLAENIKEDRAEDQSLDSPESKTKKFHSLKPTIVGFSFLILLISFAALFIVDGKFNHQEFFSYLSASLNSGPLAQAPISETEQVFSVPVLDSYLTINAETAINGPLLVEKEITTPGIVLTSGSFSGNIATANLTTDRTYTFPNSSGIVCLSTGNCFPEVPEAPKVNISGTADRISKFTAADQLGNSSISDLYAGGVSLTITQDGKVGIGNANPLHALQVQGRIQAAGDICTDLAGGKCLSTLSQTIIYGGGGGGGNLSGSGTIGNIPRWTKGNELGDSIISQSGSTLTVAGTAAMTGFKLSTSPTSGYVLTSDASGVGTWAAASGGSSNWTQSGNYLYPNTLTWYTGIATTSPRFAFDVWGNAGFGTTTNTNTALFYINSYDGTITANATITAVSFASAATDSTVRKSGEEVLREIIPISRYDIPAQTGSVSYIRISKSFDQNPLTSVPTALPGATRVYKLIIKYDDNIPANSSSSWRIYRPSAATTVDSFVLLGRNSSQTTEGIATTTANLAIPDTDWQLDVKLSEADVGKTLRTFQIFLAAFDKIN